jgi:hypothetical protein
MHHNIFIRRLGDEAVPAQPLPILFVEDTVEYKSDDGRVMIEFPGGSPFAEHVVESGKTAKVEHDGHFRCQCFIVLNDGTKIGWHAGSNLSGADHDVRRH